MLKKEKSFAFGKEVYLLGVDKDGIKYWLEEPSFDCGWYWGFGYIESYTNNNCPSRSRDINSHEHAENFYSKWCNERFEETTFSDSEKWVLCELFQNFYTLRNLAEAQYHNGKEGNYTSKRNGFDFNRLFKKDININKDFLPEVMAKIVSILGGGDFEKLVDVYKARVITKE